MGRAYRNSFAMAATAILDTDVLSDLAKGDPAIKAAFDAWLNAGNGVVLSRVTAYEFRRGVYVGSISQSEAKAGELFLVHFSVIEVDETAWDIAAKIWA